MDSPQARRLKHELGPSDKERLEQHRGQIASELPDMIARDQVRKEAREETTLSGELRRSIHKTQLPLSTIAAQTGITPIVLDEFLTGERTLRSDIMDRLARVLGYELNSNR